MPSTLEFEYQPLAVQPSKRLHQVVDVEMAVKRRVVVNDADGGDGGGDGDGGSRDGGGGDGDGGGGDDSGSGM